MSYNVLAKVNMKYLNKDIENWRPPNEEGGDDDDKEQGLAGFKKFVKLTSHRFFPLKPKTTDCM